MTGRLEDRPTGRLNLCKESVHHQLKKILITGINSYIGNSLEKWLSKNPDRYSIDKISMRGDSWKEKDFSDFDVVFHVAGIAHISSKKNMEDLYYKVNRDLAVETAKKAKQDKVRQFIFMSSIIVYGNSSCNKKVITKDTTPNPGNFYGDSKLQAEEGMSQLRDNHFRVVIIRSPMVYGKGSRGNYPFLSKVAMRVPIFPDYDNERSFLYIDNLCEFIRLMIDNEENGIFFPQNKDYVKTSEILQLIAKMNGKKIKMTKIFNPIIKIICPRMNLISKGFGNLVYEKSISEYKQEYQIMNLIESIRVTEIPENKKNSHEER